MFFGNVCWWEAWGVDGGWMPLPTRPQRYCDPASLVLPFFSSKYLYFFFIVSQFSIFLPSILFFIFLRTFFHVPIVTLPQTCYDLRLSSQQDFRLLCLTIASFLHDFLHIHNAWQSTIFYVQSRQIVAKATDG